MEGARRREAERRGREAGRELREDQAQGEDLIYFLVGVAGSGGRIPQQERRSLRPP